MSDERADRRTTDQVKLRPMTVGDLQTVLGWAADEGWNPGLDDAAAFFAADPGGFFLAEAAGAPIAAISVVNHSDEFAFLGLYLCRPDWRGRGVGIGLWRHALAHAGTRIVGLDGVPAQQANYQKSGFVTHGQTTRFEGVLRLGHGYEAVRLATEGDLERLITLEAAQSGRHKRDFLTAWFRNTENRVTYVGDGRDGMIGMVTVRRCVTGAKIGPLVARDKAVAQALLARAVHWADMPVVIDVPSGSTGLTAICGELGLTPGFQTARMYRGQVTAPPSSGFYATATLELG